jgi:shikimate kinase
METEMPNRIFLIGMPGSGKTTIGKGLADSLGYPFFDLDQLIELATISSVSAIIESIGETGFRKLEKDILDSFIESQNPPYILATGGGTVINEQSLALINQTGVSIYLQCSVNTLISRLADNSGSRPLLQQNLLEEMIPKILQNRESQYLKAHKIQPADGSVEEILTELVNKL